jgi:hypothetical protein
MSLDSLRNQAFRRFDRWSMSAKAIFRQLHTDSNG